MIIKTYLCVLFSQVHLLQIDFRRARLNRLITHIRLQIESQSKPPPNMKIERGQTALITGAGGGIGRALAVALASKGVQVTILDLKAEQGEESVRLVEEEHAKMSYKPDSPSALFIQYEFTAAFGRHQEVFGKLDICINNAGISNGPEPFYESDAWRKIIEVNLVAVIDGTSKAIQAMRGQGGGLILNVASAASFVPQSFAPVYGASKGGVAMFTRSLANLGMGIRVNALCPEYVETPMLHGASSEFLNFIREKVGFVAMERVIEAAFSILDDETKSGECIWIPANKPTQIWPDDDVKKKYSAQMKDGSTLNL